MKHCILIPGKPSKKEYEDPHVPSPSNHHWFPWIQKQLLLRGILAQTIEMPEPYAPNYPQWKAALDRFKIDPTDILVGHSRGAGFLIRYMNEATVRADKLVLVAPSFKPTGADESEKGAFYDFTLDLNLPSRINELHVLYSTDDPVQGIRETVEVLKERYPSAILHIYSNNGHFTREDMLSDEFPELLEVIMQP